MNLTNTTTIATHDNTGAFTNFWAGILEFISYGIPFLAFAMAVAVSSFLAVYFQIFLLVAMVIRPEDPGSIFNPNAQLDDYGTPLNCNEIIKGASYTNRLFGGKNDRAYMLGRVLGYIGGFAASGHIINNMESGSMQFVVKSVVIFEGLTLAGAVSGHYLLGKPLDLCINATQCPQILTRFKDLRSSALRVTPDELEETIPMRQIPDEENLSHSASTSSTLSINSGMG